MWQLIELGLAAWLLLAKLLRTAWVQAAQPHSMWLLVKLRLAKWLLAAYLLS